MTTLVCGRELVEMASPVGYGYRVIEPNLAPNEPALIGRVHLMQVRPGFFIHCADVHNLHSMTTRFMLTERISIILTLGGRTDVTLGTSRLCMEPGNARGRSGRAEGAIVSLTQPELFTRYSRQGGQERKVSISVTGEWLESAGLKDIPEHGPLLDFAKRHLSIARWCPSAKAVALAEQMIHPPLGAPLLQHLYMESRAIAILAEAFAALAGRHSGDHTGIRPRDDQRMRKLREFLNSNPATTLSLEEIAAHVGTNPSTLQRNFRAAFGMTVFEYLRERRLLIAREALERDGVSVLQAAEMAGYTSAANFATAYRRHFGLSPSQSKSWV